VFAAPTPTRVLLVDDDPAFAELTTCLLELGGVTVVGHALDGAEGVELARTLQPDVVLMDVRMPRMDGFEATRRIVESRPGAHVLVVSSSKDREDVERAREAGAAGYLPKDRVAAELVDSIEQLHEPSPRPERRIPSFRVRGWQALRAAPQG
jgi:DNA-binding NarL/FixJ family response regulator